jgi:hypothetical protein
MGGCPGSVIVVAALTALVVTRCTIWTGFTVGTVIVGAATLTRIASGRSVGIAINTAASAHCTAIEPSVDHLCVFDATSPRDSTSDPSNMIHLR